MATPHEEADRIIAILTRRMPPSEVRELFDEIWNEVGKESQDSALWGALRILSTSAEDRALCNGPAISIPFPLHELPGSPLLVSGGCCVGVVVPNSVESKEDYRHSE